MPHRSHVKGWLIAALVVCAALLVTQLSPYLGDYGDDAEFLVLGHGLAAGRGYAWVNNPEAAPHNRYPPGYPLLLAGTILASSTRDNPFGAILPAKLVTALTFAGSIALLWPIARRRLGRTPGALAVALYALNPFAIRFATQVMSDVPYILFELAALAWADRVVSGQWPVGRVGARFPRPWWLVAKDERGEAEPVVGRAGHWPLTTGHWPLQWIVLGLLLAAGAYVRTVGEAAAVGVLAWAWWHSRKGGLVASLSFLALMVPWWVRDITLAGGWRYLEELRAATYQDPGAGNAGLSDLVARAAGNAAFVLGKPGALGLAGVVGGAVAAALLVVGYWRTVRAVNGAAEWAVVPLVLAVLVWPIRTGRYLLPVVPLACIYGLVGALVVAMWASRVLAERTKDGRRQTADGGRVHGRLPSAVCRLWSRPVTVVLALGIAFALFEAAYTGRESAANLRALSGGTDAAAYYRNRPDWAHFLAAAAWVRGHAGADDLALTRRQFAFYVYSGHYADKYRFDVSDEELDYLTHGFDGRARRFVVEDAFQELRGDFEPLPPALRARGFDLQLRFESASPTVRVWELVRRAP